MIKRISSFGHALRGIKWFFNETYHAKIHAIAAMLAVLLGIYCRISKTEWGLIVLAMALVFVAECLNSALEYVVDLAAPEYHLLAKKAKDTAAGAVLLASFFSVIIASIVFIPYL